MPHVPRALCFECATEMVAFLNGVEVEMMKGKGDPYYRVRADVYQCPECKTRVVVGMGAPTIEHWEDGYPSLLRATFSGGK